jgi:5-methylcytosine-specific restriction endonuclease McrA
MRFRKIYGTRDPRSTRRWRRLRDDMLKSEPVCRQCQARISTDVHHIEPVVRRPDLALSRSNLLPCCHECHLQLDRGILRPVRSPRLARWDGAC